MGIVLKKAPNPVKTSGIHSVVGIVLNGLAKLSSTVSIPPVVGIVPVSIDLRFAYKLVFLPVVGIVLTPLAIAEIILQIGRAHV